MSLEALTGLVLILALTAYAVLGGADFGGGIWDLFARGPRQDEQREAIAHAMGPVWEANHVWLIFVVVLLFTDFPVAFGVISVGLFIPFHLVLLGIILRGAAFVFRAYSPQSSRSLGTSRSARRWGVVFGAASLITPLLLGMSLGAVSAGSLRVRDGQAVIVGTLPWLAPIALLMGALVLTLCAYLAAVYLANETQGALREDFRRRALIAGTIMVGLSAVTLAFIPLGAPHLWAGVWTLRALPFLLTGIVAALLSGWALWRRRFRLARIATVAQIGSLFACWGLAQYPYLIYPDLTLAGAAAPAATLRFVLATLPFGLAILVPSLWLLFAVFKGQHLTSKER